MPLSRQPSNLERELFRVVEPYTREGGSIRDGLPDWAEVSRGSVLWLVRQAWREGPRRDGRSGHLTDKEVAERIDSEMQNDPDNTSGERFDRSRYQLQFGPGKLMGGTRYRQTVTRTVARAFLRTALFNWDLDERDPKPRERIWTLTSSFAGLPAPTLDKAINGLLRTLYPNGDERWFCDEAVGVGPRKLYRELGRDGFSVIIFARREAIRLGPPDNQIELMANLMHDLLTGPSIYKESSVHVWAFKQPKIERPLALLPLIRPRGFLRETLRHIHMMNLAAKATCDKDWPIVPLERCVIAVQLSEMVSERIFDDVTPDAWRRLGVPEDPSAFIPVFASDPRGDCRYYSFEAADDPGMTPFFEVVDPENGLREELLAVRKAAMDFVDGGSDGPPNTELLPGWKLYSVRTFLTELPADLEDFS